MIIVICRSIVAGDPELVARWVVLNRGVIITIETAGAWANAISRDIDIAGGVNDHAIGDVKAKPPVIEGNPFLPHTRRRPWFDCPSPAFYLGGHHHRGAKAESKRIHIVTTSPSGGGRGEQRHKHAS